MQELAAGDNRETGWGIVIRIVDAPDEPSADIDDLPLDRCVSCVDREQFTQASELTLRVAGQDYSTDFMS